MGPVKHFPEPGEKSAYLLKDSSKEVESLNHQNALICEGMNGNLVRAPIDLSKPGLHILDVATANGAWLREVSKQLAEPYTLVGTDLFTEFFPKETPPNTELIKHDFTEPWPAELHGKFDLVHLRTSLAGARSASVEDAVKQLPALLKPGGWLQIMENNLEQRESNGPAHNEGWRSLVQLMDLGGSGSAMCMPGGLVKWFREAGLQDVQEIVLDIPTGKTSEDQAAGELRAKHLAERFDSVAATIKAMGGQVADNLKERTLQESREKGGAFAFVLAIGRKPA